MSNVEAWILALHGWPILLIAFALPALEASAFIGFVIPGEIAAFLGGVLAFEQRVSLLAVIAAVVSGAIIGDTVGYAVGKRWGRTILSSTVARFIRRRHLDRAENYLARRGGLAVLFGRFTAALRVLVPGLAGMSGMPYRRFAVFNVTGAVLWGAQTVLLGYLAGTGWRHVQEAAGRASILLLIIVLLVVLVTATASWLRRNPKRVRSLLQRQGERATITRIRHRYRRQIRFLARRFRPEGAFGLSLSIGLVLIGLAGWAFGGVAQDVVAKEELVAVDGPVEHFFVAHREGWLNGVMEGVTAAGSFVVLLTVILAIGTVCWVKRHTARPLLMVGGAALGAIVLSSTIKVLVDRPRPPAGQMVVAVTGFSFPSGHVTESVAVYGMLSILLGSSTASWTKRVAVGAGAVFICLLVGLSRLYLGVHWLTDVLGGYALGALWLAVLVTAVRTLESFRSGGRSDSWGNRGEHASASDKRTLASAPTSHAHRQASRRRNVAGRGS